MARFNPTSEEERLINRELEVALARICDAMPDADGVQTLRLAISYFVETYAWHLGMPAAVELVSEMNDRAREIAERQKTAMRN